MEIEFEDQYQEAVEHFGNEESFYFYQSLGRTYKDFEGKDLQMWQYFHGYIALSYDGSRYLDDEIFNCDVEMISKLYKPWIHLHISSLGEYEWDYLKKLFALNNKICLDFYRDLDTLTARQIRAIRNLPEEFKQRILKHNEWLTEFI